MMSTKKNKHKIGKNDSCWCGSGIKYKKCHRDLDLDQNKPRPTSRQKNSSKSEIEELISEKQKGSDFRIKGEKAEQAVLELAKNSFFIDWCFPNPKKTSDHKEVCDLLVVFGEICIIFQIKDLKLSKNGTTDKKGFDKNLRQVCGAKRILFDLKNSVQLENKVRKLNFDNTKIKKYHLISVQFGDKSDFFQPFEQVKDNNIHIFSKSSFNLVIGELTTIKDFCTYLEEREKLFLKTSGFIGFGEDELLAHFILDYHSFNKFLSKIDEGNEPFFFMSHDDTWDKLTKSEGYKSRQYADRYSYLWDILVERSREVSDQEQYETIARELARFSRFERRMLGQDFYELWVKACDTPKNELNAFKRLRLLNNEQTAYCFLCLGDLSENSRRFRLDYLRAFCLIAKHRYPDFKIVGLATEAEYFEKSSYDYCMQEADYIMTQEEHDEAEKLSITLETLTNPNPKSRGMQYEFPTPVNI